jgi:hypothetical protein
MHARKENRGICARMEETRHLRKIGSTRDNQIHIGELDLVHRALLGGESTDLVGRDHDVLALLLLALAGGGSVGSIQFGAGASLADHASLSGSLAEAETSHDTDSAVGAPGRLARWTRRSS